MTESADLVELRGSFLPPVAGTTRLARDLSNHEIEISVWLRRKAEPPRATPSEGRRRQLSRQELANAYGAAEDDLTKLLRYLHDIDPGIQPIEGDEAFPALARRLVALKGTVASFERAFGVRIELAQLPGLAPFIVRRGTIKVPSRLQPIVRGVFGLDARPIGEPAHMAIDTRSVAATSPVPTPPQVAGLYNFNRVATCKGQVIALMQFGGGYCPADVSRYFQDLRVRQPRLVCVGILGSGNNPGNDETHDREVTLDIEVAGAVAEEATLVSYFAPHTERGWVEAIGSAVHDVERLPMIMSISWGAAELKSSNSLTWSRTGIAAMHEQFEDAELIGMTVLAATGNHGSECKVGDRKAHVNYPASDPLVVACGATVLDDFAGNPHREIAWSRGGGGISVVFDVPSYQRSKNLPRSIATYRPGRGLPDISGFAFPGYDFRIRGVYPVRLPGTSLVAPLYAAAIARGNASVGTPTGHLHPNLYRYSGLTRDIDDAVSNNTSNGMNGAPGYFGRTGWDARTGLGVFQPEP